MALISPAEKLHLLKTFGSEHTVIIDDGTQQGLKVDAIFDAPFRRQVVIGGEIGVESSAPMVTMLAREAKDIVAHESRIWIDGNAFFVTGTQPDGSGMVQLVLQEEE